MSGKPHVGGSWRDRESWIPAFAGMTRRGNLTASAGVWAGRDRCKVLRSRGGHVMNAEVGLRRAAADRVAAVDWAAVAATLDAHGWAILPKLLSAGECDGVAALYDESEHFRSRIVMARHGFGRGEYRYFAYPLPPLVEDLRTSLYGKLAPIADRWHALMGMEARFPPDHAAYLDRCHAAGQERPTPLLLRYQEGDYNCLHQDLYGEHVF